MSVLLDDAQVSDATKVMADAGRMLDEERARASAAEQRERAAELRAEELADRVMELTLRLAQYETATQPPAVA